MGVRVFLLFLLLYFAYGSTDFNGLGFDAEETANLTVTFIYVGEISDSGYNYAFELARNALQVHYRYDVWCFYDIADTSDRVSTLDKLYRAANTSDVVVTTSSDLRSYTIEVASVTPNTKFLMAGGTSSLPNVGIYQTLYNDARFLTGIIAALKSTSNIICFLSSFRYDFLLGGFNAWVKGAQYVNPNITAYIAFTDSWNNVENERFAANAMIDKGCDVINGQTNNIIWQQEAAKKGVLTIGFNSDIRLLVGEGVLTSVVNDFVKIFIEYFDNIMYNETFKKGVTFYNMENGGVYITDFGKNVTRNEARYILAEQVDLTDNNFFCGPIYSYRLCNNTDCWDSVEEMVPNGTCVSNWNLTIFRPFLIKGVKDFGTLSAPAVVPTPTPSPTVIIRSMNTTEIILIVVGGTLALLLISGFTIYKVRQHRTAAVKVLKLLEEGEKKNYKINYNELKDMRKIGAGNFGTVYFGEYRGADVAVKKLKLQDLQSQQIQEFTQEVSVMVGLRHPNIVLLMGACSESPNLCIVTEYMPQGSLYSVLHNENIQYSAYTAKAMILDMLKGLQFIHSAGLLHRDLKSPNLLIDKRGNLKLADFGLTILQTQSTDKMIHVSVPWTAPEIFSCEPYTAKCDVYSVAVIMWEILTRTMPYSAMMAASIPKAVMQGKRPDLPLITPSLLLPSLIPLIEQSWSQNPDARPDIADLRRDVERIDTVDSSSSRDNRRSDLLGGITLERGENRMHREEGEDGGVWDTYEKSSLSSSSSSSTVSIVLPKMAAPSGVSTYVFIDVPESTHLWEWNPYVTYKSMCILHLTVELLIFKHRGYMSRNDGDSYLLVFAEATDGVAFAVDFHMELLKQEWPTELLTNIHAQEENYSGTVVWRGLRVRTAAHPGPATRTQGTQIGQIIYSGPSVDFAVKLGRLGLPGQTLISEYARKLIGNTGNRIINQSSMVDLQTKPSRVYQLTFHSLLSRIFNPPLVECDDSVAPQISETDLLSKPERWVIPIKELKFGEKIGAGSFGETFLASHQGREVAVKILPVKNLKYSVNLELRMEIVNMLQLSHPNVVSLYGMCLQDSIGLVQEFVPRGSLYSILHSDIDLSWDRKLSFAQGIVAGMAYLHANDILHYDVKPSNFLVTNNWEIKVGDLGFARIKTEYQTTTQCASVAWTAPEVFDGEGYSKLSEVYSFGIVLWEIITRKNAWDGVHAVKIADMVCQGQRPSVSDIMATSSKAPALIKLAGQCWNQKREDRPPFHTISDVLGAIK